VRFPGAPTWFSRTSGESPAGRRSWADVLEELALATDAEAFAHGSA
jgi:hypothetical protein